jgi:hypothetical protein
VKSDARFMRQDVSHVQDAVVSSQADASVGRNEMLETEDALDGMRLEHRCMELDTGQVRPDVSQSQGNAIYNKQLRLWKGRNAGLRLEALGGTITESACLELDTRPYHQLWHVSNRCSIWRANAWLSSDSPVEGCRRHGGFKAGSTQSFHSKATRPSQSTSWRRLVGSWLHCSTVLPDLSSLSLAQRGTWILDGCFDLRVLIALWDCAKPVQSHIWRRSSRRRNLRCPKPNFSDTFLDFGGWRTGC